MSSLVACAKETLKKELGFVLVLKQSLVHTEGVGVFVTDEVSEGRLVGLYPGVYNIREGWG